MDGILNVYKEKGMTSFDVVKRVKKLSNTKKVGHGGTLDPLAMGVLPVFLGNTTKFLEYVLNDRKIYKVTMLLGKTSDTYDLEGKILSEKDVLLNEDIIYWAINSFLGDTYQIPPMYSAIKLNGKKLYELAREGIEVPREKRKINIKSIKDIEINLPYVTFTVNCSKGTYIRSLCYDIGEKLNVGALMFSLERISTGPFNLSNSVSINNLTYENINEYIIPIEELFLDFPKVKVNNKLENLLINGVLVNNFNFVKDIQEEILYAVFNEEDLFLGIGKKLNLGFKLIKIMVRSKK